MLYLVDTGVLLRLFNRADPEHTSIRSCLRELRLAGHRFVISLQNVAEFWNVSTRPTGQRGGYNLSVEATERRVRALERICDVLPDSPGIYAVWRKVVSQYQVKGVRVHDARLVAWMETQAIPRLITLNQEDFKRYKGVVAQTPGEILTQLSKGN